MQTIYQHVLADRFELLHPAVRAFLSTDSLKRASGPMHVVRENGWVRNRIATLLGIPPAGGYRVSLEVLPCRGGERWLRHFDRWTLKTRQRAWRGLLLESSGPATVGFELLIRDAALFFQPRRAWLLGVPIPLWLSPKIEVENRGTASGGWTVSVCFSVAGLGQVARYEGEMEAEGLM